MQLQVKQPVLYTNVINRHLQKYSHTQNFQNIQQTQLRKQTPKISNEIHVMQQTTQVNLKQRFN